MNDPQAFLRELFDAAVAAADPMRIVPPALPPRPSGRVVIVGAGKASARMAEAVESVWGPCDGLVITRYGHGRPCSGIEIVEAAHPVPDAAGVAATGRMLDLLAGLGPDDLCVALISGGGSALLCAPAGEITLEEKQAINAALLASGAPIDEMNIVRKHLSRVKGGQLAATVHPARLLALAISDVPGDDPAFIASGPTVADSSSAADALALLQRWNIPLASSVERHLSGGSGVIAPHDPRLDHADTKVIAAPAQSLDAAAALARSRGLEVRQLGDAIEGEARDLGRSQAQMALSIQSELQPGAQPVLLLSGGEVTVTRQGNGTGGPNAETMLAAALALNGAPGIWALACDTDGVDGAAEVAGAQIGPDTPAAAQQAGANLADALTDNDAHTVFQRIDRQVVTGPTLTNVNDFRAILVTPP